MKQRKNILVGTQHLDRLGEIEHKTFSGIEIPYNNTPYPVIAKVKQSYEYSVFVYGNTETAFDFAEAINCLNMAEEGDSVTVMLSGGGGCISSTDAFLHAIKYVQDKGVPVHCVISGLCASAHTFIALACSSFECAEGTHFLIHNGSLGDGGSYNQFKASSQFFLKYMEKRFRDVYEHFLTEQELSDVMEGKDIWLTPDEWVERYEKRNALIQEQLELEQLEKEEKEL